MEPAEPAGGGRRPLAGRTICTRIWGKLKGERPSPSPRGEKRGTRARSTRVSLPVHRMAALLPHHRGGREQPGSGRAHPALPVRRDALPLGLRPALRRRCPAHGDYGSRRAARSAPHPRAGTGGRGPGRGVAPVVCPSRSALLSRPCWERVGRWGRWSPQSGSLPLLTRVYELAPTPPRQQRGI